MSRAFVREDAPDATPQLPDLPASPHPNHVTPAGLAQLHARLAEAQEELARLRARPERLDKLPEATAERDIRYLSARIASAIPFDPGSQPQDRVAFGAEVTVQDEEGRTTIYAIVGEDEADAAHRQIAPHSPLAQALIGAEVGDLVDWPRPAGAVTLEIVAIRYPAA
ncbi:GreA/GreB family elongation factor [Frigidibacter sp.]|uniref:GreA/GreB family elongation factor n=1 Tax=Frigidibacter sp. TaxID=2586418 RepID=UPI0027373AE9|nr:GreA/GreB family elongation factor [Frigidibacter sp.]MDP3341160.1 GreA/GreB family elongation factor [Frigidibacter sp.]